MISKLCPARRPVQNPADFPNLIRSTFAFAARAMAFWKPGGGARQEDRVPPGIDTDPTIEELLERIEGEPLTFHNVTSRYGNIDHVLLSRERGIFLIEEKAHSGRVSVVDGRLWLNGRLPEKDFVAQTLRNTYWLIEEIRNATGMEAGIIPLIVFTNAFVDPRRPLKGIPITDKRSLLATIQREGEPMPAPLWTARDQIAALLGGAPSAGD